MPNKLVFITIYLMMLSSTACGGMFYTYENENGKEVEIYFCENCSYEEAYDYLGDYDLCSYATDNYCKKGDHYYTNCICGVWTTGICYGSDLMACRDQDENCYVEKYKCVVMD